MRMLWRFVQHGVTTLFERWLTTLNLTLKLSEKVNNVVLQVIILSEKSLNRLGVIPVACVEPKVYFGNGVEVCESDTLWRWDLFRSDNCLSCNCCHVNITKHFSKDRAKYTFGSYLVLLDTVILNIWTQIKHLNIVNKFKNDLNVCPHLF